MTFHDNDGIQVWTSVGHVDKAAFVAELVADADYQRCATEFDWPEPTVDDVAHELICWDEDEPENIYYLPDMEADRQEAIKEGYSITEPSRHTSFMREGGWHSRAAIAARSARPMEDAS